MQCEWTHAKQHDTFISTKYPKLQRSIVQKQKLSERHHHQWPIDDEEDGKVIQDKAGTFRLIIHPFSIRFRNRKPQIC